MEYQGCLRKHWKSSRKIQNGEFSASVAPIQKGEKFSLMQCLQNELEWKQMEGIPCVSAVRSLMNAQTCTKLDISFAVGMLGRQIGRAHV